MYREYTKASRMPFECTSQYSIFCARRENAPYMHSEYTRCSPSPYSLPINPWGPWKLPPYLCFSFFTLLVRGSSSEESEAAAPASFSRMSAGLTPLLNPPFANLRGAHSSFNESDRSTLPKMSFIATT